MSTSEGKGISIERIIIIVLAVLLLFALFYIAFTMGRRTAPGAPVEEPVADQPGAAELPPADPAEPVGEPAEEQPAASAPEASPTSGVQRLTLQPTPTPFALTNEDDPRQILDLSQPDYFDYMSDPETWYDYDDENATYRVEDGHLLGIDNIAGKGLWWSYTGVRPSGNLYAEITATNGDCIGRDTVGLVIRIDPMQTPSGYGLEVSCDGAYRLIRFSSSGPIATPVDWTPSSTINQGAFATNRLGLWAYYGKFYFFINGNLAGEYFDHSPLWTYGYFAAFVKGDVSYPLTATFDDFALWDIPFIP